MMLEQATAIFLALLAADSAPARVELSARDTAIERCTAVAEMLASAYVTFPDSVQPRTDRINEEKKRLEVHLGTTDKHLMSAYGSIAFYDGKRMAGAVSKSEPINGMRLAAEGAARCMAATFDHGAL